MNIKHKINHYEFRHDKKKLYIFFTDLTNHNDVMETISLPIDDKDKLEKLCRIFDMKGAGNSYGIQGIGYLAKTKNYELEFWRFDDDEECVLLWNFYDPANGGYFLPTKKYKFSYKMKEKEFCQFIDKMIEIHTILQKADET